MRDEFTDYGLTSVILGNINNESLDIIQWVISCRTFNRNYELKILNAIAQFQRTLISTNSKFDKWLRGELAFTDEEIDLNILSPVTLVALPPGIFSD